MLHMVSRRLIRFTVLITFNYSGREYGTLSIEIHLKACAKKWEIEEDKKPPKERRPVPTKPKTFDDVGVHNYLTCDIDGHWN